MKKSHVIIVGAIAIATVACIAFAMPPAPPGPPGGFMAGPPPMGPPMGPPPDFAMAGPDEGPMGMLFAGFLDRTRKARMELMGLKDEHRAMMLTGTADLKKMAQLDEQEVKLVSEIMSEKFKMRRNRLSVLTPDQMEKLASLVADKRPPHHMPPPPHGAKGEMPSAK
jgi:Spy/CpxP family protein refolding chaperone